MQINLPDIKLKCSDPHPNSADRERSIQWARDLVKRQDWIIVDTETTGLGDTDEIIQIAALSSDNQAILDTFVRPLHCRQIPAEASAVHHITMEMLKDAPTFSELMPRLRELFTDKLVVFYNAGFDCRMLERAAIAHGFGEGMFKFKRECAMLAYSAFVGERINGKKDYKWQRLSGGDHSAIGDCRATLALIRKLSEIQSA